MSAGLLDAGLPGLATALDPARMSARLGELLSADSGTAPAAWRVVGVELLKHKPGRRCALAYSLDGPRGRERIFAKTFKNERGAAIFVSMRNFFDALAGDSVRVPRPIGYLPEIKLLVTEYVEGRELAAALYEGRSEEAPRRMARAAAAFHGASVACARRWSPQKEIRNTREWIAGLAGRGPGAGPRARELAEVLEAAAASFPARLLTPIHRDFYPEQLRDADGVTALLDLDDTRAGDPAVDVGNFLAHLTLRAVQFPAAARGCGLARPAFLEEYRVLRPELAEDPAFAARVRFFQATSLLRLSGVYSARERWASVVPEKLLDACEGVVTEVV